MQPLGCPVVPEVNAISATSSAAVSAFANAAGLRSSAASSEPAPPSPKYRARLRSRQRVLAISSSSFSRTSQSAAPIRALSTMTASSFARRSGIVATAMQPALMMPNQHAAIIGLFGPRSSTRLPGTSFRSSIRTCAIWLARTRSWRYVQEYFRPPINAWSAGRSPCPAATILSRSSAAQFRRAG